MTVQPDARGKVYRRVTDGVEDFITVKEALAEVNDLMMNRKRDYREMSSSQGHHTITYRNGVRVVLTEVDAPKAESAERIVTVKGKRYVVSSVVPEQTERRKIAEHSYSLPHPAYVRYWSERNGKAFGPTRHASGNNKPGTVGRAIWDAVAP